MDACVYGCCCCCSWRRGGRGGGLRRGEREGEDRERAGGHGCVEGLRRQKRGDVSYVKMENINIKET